MPKASYNKGKKIGSGSFGTVFLGTDKSSGETVVLKEIALRGLSAKDVKASLAEVDVLKKLRHGNIIAYRDSYRDSVDKSICIVMEHAAGGDLGSLIHKRAKASGRFSEPEVVRIMAQCVDALAYCHHTCHLLHRDLKPGNVFLSAGGDVKLGDFGISRVLTSTNAMASTQCGTPLFMSPELASGKPYDVGVDIWALGCVLWNLTTLRPPWQDRVSSKGGMMELMRLITTSTLDMSVPKQTYSPELCGLLATMLSKTPTTRPSCKTLLRHVLVRRGLAADGPAVPPPIPPVKKQSVPSTSPKSSPAPPPPPPRVKPSPPPANCSPPAYSVSYGGHTPLTLTFGSVGAMPRPAAALPPVPARGGKAPPAAAKPPVKPPAANVMPRVDEHEEAAFGAEAHVAAAAMQRSVRRKQRPRPPSAAARKPPLGSEEYRAAAMAKLDGLLGEVRAIHGGEPPAPPRPTPPPGPVRLTPAQRKANALAREREELANARRAQEEAIQGQREQYAADDAAAAAARAEQLKQMAKKR